MRISGNYFERLINIWVPYAVFMSIVFLLGRPDSVFIILVPITVILLFWMIDCICLSKMNLKTLYVADVVYIGDVRILPKDIVRIKPITRKAGRLDFKTIEFTFINNGNIQKLSVLAKPIRIFRDDQSRTYKLLFSSFPNLKRKLKASAIR